MIPSLVMSMMLSSGTNTDMACMILLEKQDIILRSSQVMIEGMRIAVQDCRETKAGVQLLLTQPEFDSQKAVIWSTGVAGTGGMLGGIYLITENKTELGLPLLTAGISSFLISGIIAFTK